MVREFYIEKMAVWNIKVSLKMESRIIKCTDISGFDKL